jgi:hypothetical protein
MKPHPSAACLLLLLLPTLGAAQSKRVHPLPVDGPVNVMPISADAAEPRSAVPLRETLRQPFDEVDNKPYRLSTQERQRMREQLRNQSFYEPPKK